MTRTAQVGAARSRAGAVTETVTGATPMEFDTRVRLHVMRHLIATGRAPSVAETAHALGAPESDVAAASRRLADGRVIVLEPGTLDVRMANPFSAVPTAYEVHTPRGRWWGNCGWDALGILAALDTDGRVATRCQDCGEPIEVAVENGRLVQADCVAHFAVPAAKWWDDIIFT